MLNLTGLGVQSRVAILNVNAAPRTVLPRKPGVDSKRLLSCASSAIGAQEGFLAALLRAIGRAKHVRIDFADTHYAAGVPMFARGLFLTEGLG